MAIVNAIRNKSTKVIGIDSDPLSAGLHLSDKGYVTYRGDNPKFLDDVLRICDIKKPNLSLTGPDKCTITVSKNTEPNHPKFHLQLHWK